MLLQLCNWKVNPLQLCHCSGATMIFVFLKLCDPAPGMKARIRPFAQTSTVRPFPHARQWPRAWMIPP